MGNVIPAYVCKQTACRQLDMSDDTFDKYVRGGLKRWKWSEIVAVLDGGSASAAAVATDPYGLGIGNAKAAHA
jgi:hypothetical protein